ncbi:MAG TPA: ketoacyl-ACP synthase III [Myxococcales bacterium LLY-WYZ-16_1]|nr:ketoacyl-ACP synthase III [Myxococcales bacterium LLY-WYZ-16_1]
MTIRTETGAQAEIIATGCFVPEREVPNAELAERFEPKFPEFVTKMEAATGIRTRWYAPDDWATSDLALRASQEALARAGMNPSELDLILLGTDTPDYITPATSVVLQEKLGAKNAGTFDIGCACASFPTGLLTAAGIVRTQPGIRNVLVVGAYMMQRLADPNDPMIFFYGDGAGAAILRRSDTPGVLQGAFLADGSYAKHWGIFSGGTAEPATETSVREGRTQVRMPIKYPPDVNDIGWPRLMRTLAERNEFEMDDVDLAIFTQVRRNTILTVGQELGIPEEKLHMVMHKWGYTGSACIGMALHDAVSSGRAQPGQLVTLVGSGVGYNQAAVAVQLTDNLRRNGS